MPNVSIEPSNVQNTFRILDGKIYNATTNKTDTIENLQTNNNLKLIKDKNRNTYKLQKQK